MKLPGSFAVQMLPKSALETVCGSRLCVVSYPALEVSPPHVIVSVLPRDKVDRGNERTATHTASLEKSEKAMMPEAKDVTAGL